MKNNFKISIPLAIVITLAAVIYQRSTGPTYPKKVTLESQGKVAKVKFPRSHGGETNAPVEIPLFVDGLKAKIIYKRYPTKDEWSEIKMHKKANRLYAELPNQPPAGKLTYFIEWQVGEKIHSISSKEDPIYIRYKGEVPTFILAPHVFFMFFSMLLAATAFFEAIYRTDRFRTMTRLTLGSLLIGGMVLGPIVQKYAFGVYWAGFPYDWDLTDNKLLIGVLSWLFATLLTLKSTRRWPTIFAAIVLFGVYSIPHSMQGSEFDYDKGEVITDRD